MLASTLSAEEMAAGAAANEADAAAQAAEDIARKRRGKLLVEYEKKGRKGKPCTIVSGFQGSDDELVRLKRLLQSKIATGGSHCWNTDDPFDGQILLQGDCRQKSREILSAEGYEVKVR